MVRAKVGGGPILSSRAKGFVRELRIRIPNGSPTLPLLKSKGLTGPFSRLRDHVEKVEVKRRFLWTV